MRLYLIRYGDKQCEWAGTQADAKKQQRNLEETLGRLEVDSFVEFEVPTDKAGLLQFLNKHARQEPQ